MFKWDMQACVSHGACKLEPDNFVVIIYCDYGHFSSVFIIDYGLQSQLGIMKFKL